MGDIALVGHPIKGKIVATRPGHFANTRLARIMRQEMKKALSKRIFLFMIRHNLRYLQWKISGKDCRTDIHSCW